MRFPFLVPSVLLPVTNASNEDDYELQVFIIPYCHFMSRQNCRYRECAVILVHFEDLRFTAERLSDVKSIHHNDLKNKALFCLLNTEKILFFCVSLKTNQYTRAMRELYCALCNNTDTLHDNRRFVSFAVFKEINFPNHFPFSSREILVI